MSKIDGRDLYNFLAASDPKKIEFMKMSDKAQNAILCGAFGIASYQLQNIIEGINITPDNTLSNNEVILKVVGLPESKFIVI